MATKNNHRDKIPTQNCSFPHRKQQLCARWLSRVHGVTLVLQKVKNAKSSQTVHSCTISSGTEQPEAQMRGDKDQKCSFGLYDGASCFSMAAARMDTLSRRMAPASQTGIYLYPLISPVKSPLNDHLNPAGADI